MVVEPEHVLNELCALLPLDIQYIVIHQRGDKAAPLVCRHLQSANSQTHKHLRQSFLGLRLVSSDNQLALMIFHRLV